MVDNTAFWLWVGIAYIAGLYSGNRRFRNGMHDAIKTIFKKGDNIE